MIHQLIEANISTSENEIPRLKQLNSFMFKSFINFLQRMGNGDNSPPYSPSSPDYSSDEGPPRKGRCLSFCLNGIYIFFTGQFRRFGSRP